MVALAVTGVIALIVLLLTVKYWWPFDRVRYIVSRHVGSSARSLTTLSRPFARIDLPNIERALSDIAPGGRRFGPSQGFGMFMGGMSPDLGALLAGNARAVGVQTEIVEVGPDEDLACMMNGMALVDDPAPAVIYVRSQAMMGTLEVQVAAKSPQTAQAVLDRIAAFCATENVYRGRMISVECEKVARRGTSCLSLRFHDTPSLTASDVILAPKISELIERNTIGFFQNIDKMRATGRSVKRGILLYGRPGTGKTMTAKWVASAVPGLTTFFLAADQLFLIKDCCQMARMLAPSMVVLEDVDLVARDRGQEEDIHSRITLNQLLNEMDGIADNAGVLFLLTTNRPEDLENALAARPGRIDQAIEYPLPDAVCRWRLLDKYLAGLPTDDLDLDDLVIRTDGAPPAFIEELVRKALSFAILESSDGVLRHEHFRSALEELLFTGGDLTRKLLGFSDDLLSARAIPG